MTTYITTPEPETDEHYKIYCGVCGDELPYVGARCPNDGYDFPMPLYD